MVARNATSKATPARRVELGTFMDSPYVACRLVEREAQDLPVAGEDSEVADVEGTVAADRDAGRKDEALQQHLDRAVPRLAQQPPVADAGIGAGSGHEATRDLDDV